MSRPRYKWTEDQVERLIDGWNSRLSIENIAVDVGAAKFTVRQKIKEMGLTRPPRPGESEGSRESVYWDERLFESYADRKARLAKDKAKLGGAL